MPRKKIVHAVVLFLVGHLVVYGLLTLRQGSSARDNPIQALVSADVVVLENGHRNDGWTDFRDNHLIRVHGTGSAFQVGICEGGHQFRNHLGLYQTDY